MNAIWVLCAAFLLQSPPPQQMPPGSIAGAVFRLGSLEPVAGADVELTGITLATTNTVRTADDGRFAFALLTPGQYRLIATQPGGRLAPGEYGQRDVRGRGVAIEIASGQKITDAQLFMIPTGSISGRITDADDEPVANARVMALDTVYRNGRRTLTIVQAVRTNDLGNYRLFWLRPGRYFIAALRDDQRAYSFAVHVVPPTQFGSREDASSPVVRSRTRDDGTVVEEITVPVYYGGGADENRARAVDLSAGGIVSAVDISVADGVTPARRVAGRVVGADAQAAAGALVRLVPHRSAPHTIIPNTTADKQGEFHLTGVIPGAYTLVATAGAGRGYSFTESFIDIAQGTSAMLPLQVTDRDLDNVGVTLASSYTLNGRVYVEGQTPPAAGWDVTRARVSMSFDPNLLGLPRLGAVTPQQGQRPSGVPLADGSFVLNGFGAGHYRVSVNAIPLNAYVKAIQWGGINVLQDGMQIGNAPQAELSILINTDGGTIQGLAVNERSELVSNAAVVLVPDAPARGGTHLYRTAFSDSAGKFQLKAIAPGSYKLFSWAGVSEGAWLDPDFLRTYEVRGTPVTFSDNSTQQVRVLVIPD
jgi:protocatechuate 3,4-dioxygenase beta subunit